MLQLRIALAGYHKTAREQGTPCILPDLIRFPGEKGFVHGNASFQHLCVRTDLVPGRQQYHITLYQFL